MRAFVRQPHRLAAAAGVGLIWGGVSAWLAADWTGRIRDWAVMSDEMLYVKLATSIGDTWSPLPRLHGTSVGIINQLYPLFLAPLFGPLSVPEAFHDAHLCNAVLMASACVPAYLIARRFVGRPSSLAVSLLSVTVPWIVLSGVLMTEVVAYPAFLWAVLACTYAMRSVSPKGDLVAIAALVVAVLARTQFLALAVVLPVALLVNAALTRSSWLSVVRAHRVLVGGCLIAGAVIIAVAVTGSIGNALGVYSTTVHGSVLPAGVWREAAAHLDEVGVGCGLVPLLVGMGWILATAAWPLRPDGVGRNGVDGVGRNGVRHRNTSVEHLPQSPARAGIPSGVRHREARTFAIFSLLAIVALAVETASYDLRFGGEHVVRDRYLFYIVPLLLVGSAAAFAETRRRPTAIGVAVLTAFFAATVHWLDFPTTPGSWVDSPARTLNGTLADESAGLSTSAFVAVAGLCLGGLLVLWLLALPPATLGVAALAFLLPFTVLTTRKQMNSVASSNGTSGRPVAGPPGTVLNWIDSSLPSGAKAAMIPFAQSPSFGLDAIGWWDVEFWNRTVQRTLVTPNGLFSYAPFPNTILRTDWTTGEVPGTDDEPAFVVYALDDARLQIAGVPHAQNLGLGVLVANRPYRLAWMTRGLDVDGWARPRRAVVLRVYAQRGKPERVEVQVTFAAPQEAARYRIHSGNIRAEGEVPAGMSRTQALVLCVPGGSAVNVAIAAESTATIPGPPLSNEPGPSRRVGARVGPITATHTGRSCAP
jgi:hypothetical protein